MIWYFSSIFIIKHQKKKQLTELNSTFSFTHAQIGTEKSAYQALS